jgi:type II secretory ATPase GspE/PulE/Tfp pilus assembly ATPase PilB-like protein
MINKRANAEDLKLYAAEKQHMISMLQDGLVKAKMGITTIEEVLRVTRD